MKVKSKQVGLGIMAYTLTVSAVIVAGAFGERYGIEGVVRVAQGVLVLLAVSAAAAVGFFGGAIAYSDKPGVRKWFAQNLPREDGEWFGAE